MNRQISKARTRFEISTMAAKHKLLVATILIAIYLIAECSGNNHTNGTNNTQATTPIGPTNGTSAPSTTKDPSGATALQNCVGIALGSLIMSYTMNMLTA